ncbi:MAG: type II toxin-antitoxin system RelE/ParE family toxin [Thermodesulfobacteriota bacterium]|nr:type II toxin-antitoxin system RelE/ParE family toxin [Thermodesulfobacteriota bacterium]
MNRIYKVEWAGIAENDLIEMINYIAIDSPANALKIFQKIKKKASGLYAMPERCRIVPELKDQGIIQYRELIESPWRIIFRVADRKVYVLSVLDSRRNIEDILLKRLVNSHAGMCS